MPTQSELIKQAESWFSKKNWKAFPYQKKTWKALLNGDDGLVNAPTGSGKTYSIFLGIVLASIRNNLLHEKGLKAIWITPIRALSQEIKTSCEKAVIGLNLEWTIEIRTGDTSSQIKARQKKKMPDMLITTPESLHILLAQKKSRELFTQLRFFVVDEWHELIGSKRGVQVELALAVLKLFNPIQIWGLSATIGNLEQAAQILVGNDRASKINLIKSKFKKRIEVIPIFPKSVETLPWAGYLGIKMIKKVIPVIKKSQSTLIFTNTRSQCEIWYQKLLAEQPDFAGQIAMHHGSISKELRIWVEQAIHDKRLKAVVCTSSLDLGVDFRPVETIIQIGSPKGVARFMQRAGRSGHQPGQKSVIYFLPTHSLELIEAAALRTAINDGIVEDRIPYIRSFDVLVQFLVTLAVGDGFIPDEIYPAIKNTFCFESMNEEEWNWCLSFIHTGGKSLYAYDEFKKVEADEKGHFFVKDFRIARRHRLSIGTIVSDTMLLVRWHRGGSLGHVEEYFVARLNEGDIFWFAGRSLELVRIKDMQVLVKPSKKTSGKVPSWQGGRMPLSSQMSELLRIKLNESFKPSAAKELKFIRPLLEKQKALSHIPNTSQFLIESIQSDEGHHLFFYPFEGRFVHEGMGTLLAYRISKLTSISFSLAFNDYGFEMLSDQEIPIKEALKKDLLSSKNLTQDINQSINGNEMARRKFRDVASISGLVFKGFPGHYQKDKHIQSSATLFFEVFKDYEPNNLLYKQAYQEAMEFQLEESRLRAALERIENQEIVFTEPEEVTPFCFPIMVDRLREKMSSETLQERLKKMNLLYD